MSQKLTREEVQALENIAQTGGVFNGIAKVILDTLLRKRLITLHYKGKKPFSITEDGAKKVREYYKENAR